MAEAIGGEQGTNRQSQTDMNNATVVREEEPVPREVVVTRRTDGDGSRGRVKRKSVLCHGPWLYREAYGHPAMFTLDVSVAKGTDGPKRHQQEFARLWPPDPPGPRVEQTGNSHGAGAYLQDIPVAVEIRISFLVVWQNGGRVKAHSLNERPILAGVETQVSLRLPREHEESLAYGQPASERRSAPLARPAWLSHVAELAIEQASTCPFDYQKSVSARSPLNSGYVPVERPGRCLKLDSLTRGRNDAAPGS